ncbi:MG2 domain-containing protein [uncultured Croceitalea sp.]|uniref:alpha-2-macroglobulin family protein n=1 Tax=uncultured Croceitalea sp. TaxID=1798908 RepID=UPI003306115A
MKYYAILIATILFAQMSQSQNHKDTFETLWEQVKKLERDDMTKSALKVAMTISENAKNEKNSAHTVKSLLYIAKYALILEEDAQLKIIADFKQEIKTAKAPTKNILESYLANLYWQYFQQNRYRFYNRTNTEVKVDTVDFRTWDLTTLFNEITLHFEASLADEKVLQQTPVADFKEILNQYENSDNYRPTLFDLLAHTALSFYSTSENAITRPAEKFEINDPQLLCHGTSFVQLNIETTDSTSLQTKALCIYQKLLMLHANATKPYTYAEVDIERLRFIYQNAVFEKKTEQLIEVFQNAASANKGKPAASLYQYEVAAVLSGQGDTYQAKTNEEYQWKKAEAITLCKNVIKTYPQSRGAEKCKTLKSDIERPYLHLRSETDIPIKQTSRALVTYKNIDELKFTAHRITQKEWAKLEDLYPDEKKLAFIKKLSEIESWEVSLKTENDYQSHSTEIAIPPLKNGHYIILAQYDDDKTKTFAYNKIQVTDLALITTQTDAFHDFQVVDRNTGKPITGAQLHFSYRLDYNDKRLNKTLVTDRTGTVSIESGSKNWSEVNITIKHDGEQAFYENYYIYRRYDNNAPTDSYPCFLFTDRSIYRPGQPLYFKGIALKSGVNKSVVLDNVGVTVELFDANSQSVHQQEFITNAYGSFSGEFITPNNGLTGQHYLQVRSKAYNLNGYTNFSVEEYKRPKFETSFESITESYKVNDTVTVNGKARAYAGSNITDAKVTYRVKRSVFFPRWYYRGYPGYNSSPQEITHGETTTDASGAYSIDFKALPDAKVSKANMPTFNYEVTADVTDINGETHSATTYVTVGYHTMTANMGLSSFLDKESKDHKVYVSTTNLNGQFAPAKGVVKMYKLKAPDKVIRPRLWEAPDYPGFSASKFKELFPHDAYKNEHDPSTWEKGKLVWQSTFDTEKSREISLGSIKKWLSGKYILELETRDKFGQEVKDVLETTLFSVNDKTLADNQLFHIKTDKDSYAIGDEVKVTLLSNAENLNVTLHIEKDHKVMDTKIITLSKNRKSFTVPVKSNDLGGFAITYSYAIYNWAQSGVLNIQVPYPSTDLQIETLTFRDKLQPGTDETWSFKIKGQKGDQVTAEVLASMYDASLNAFRGHSWSFYPISRPGYYSDRRINARRCFTTSTFQTYQDYQSYNHTNPSFDTFNWFGFYFGYGGNYYNNRSRMLRKSAAAPVAGEVLEMEASSLDEVVTVGNGSGSEQFIENKAREDSVPHQQIVDNTDKDNEVQIRKNLQETAFFFPQLQTDKDGHVSFNFTTPEALTKWNLQLLAHTKDLQSSSLRLQTVTQKELMVIPNVPRFLREGDKIIISTKIANLTDKSLSGQAQLLLFDAITGKDISKDLLLENAIKTAFKVDSLNNTQVSWQLQIPERIQAVQYKVIAKAGNYSDGEQSALPVLTNRMLVTETLPMWVRSNKTKQFTLNKLKNVSSPSLKHHKLTLEITSNPAWYAVQALPYLMEYPYECNEQTFSKYYANTLASHIANSNPKIREVFNLWANSEALTSNLEKNEELKSLLIQETPWLRDAQSESEQKKRIALLFNLNKMKNEQATALNKLERNQKSSGAWAWFNGGPDNRFITQHILTGLGHITKLGASSSSTDTKSMVKKAMRYLDDEFVKEYEYMKKYTSDINKDHLSQTQLHYLYMRSFFSDIKTSNKVDKVIAYYKGQAQKYWMNKSLYAKGLLALVLYRMEDAKTSTKILKALEENSIVSEELGMYWKENTSSWYWYQAPIETQALLIEAFSEIRSADVETTDNLKIWLLKNKQTNQWKTTKATTDAIYALLLQGSDWLSVTDAVAVLVGGNAIEPSKLEDVKVEAGTGYYKTSWNGAEVQSKMADIEISKKGDGIAWGALYWQYFEDLDKITPAETPLKLKKKLFLKKNTNTGEQITEVTEKTKLAVGDLVRVRIELRVDRAMEFVHMKDMRAAGLEPINVLSRYKWQDGLGYYEATKDASTNFFFDYLPKGVYVFEYDLRANNAGDFSNGITTIQSMYAPEFSSHSEGIRVSVENGE